MRGVLLWLLAVVVFCGLAAVSTAAHADAIAHEWVSQDYVHLTHEPCKNPQVLSRVAPGEAPWEAHVYTYRRQHAACWNMTKDHKRIWVVMDTGNAYVFDPSGFKEAWGA